MDEMGPLLLLALLAVPPPSPACPDPVADAPPGLDHLSTASVQATGGEADLDALDREVLKRAKATLASDLDARLPKRPLEDWLREVAGADAKLAWESHDCGEQDGSGRERDAPLCGEVSGPR